MKNYKFRKMSVNDNLHEVFSLLAQLTTAPVVNSEKWQEYMEKYSDHDLVEIWVLENENHELIGTFSLFFMPKLIHGISPIAYFQDFVIDEKYRSFGLGGEVLDFAFKRCELRGCYKVLLECKEDLISYYRKHGFENVGKSISHYVMTKSL